MGDHYKKYTYYVYISYIYEIPSIGEDVKQLEPLNSVCGDVKWCSHHGKRYGVHTDKLKIELSFAPPILLLGICGKELQAGSQRGICTPMFVTALFTTDKRGSNPSVHRQMNGWAICGRHVPWSVIRP